MVHAFWSKMGECRYETCLHKGPPYCCWGCRRFRSEQTIRSARISRSDLRRTSTAHHSTVQYSTTRCVAVELAFGDGPLAPCLQSRRNPPSRKCTCWHPTVNSSSDAAIVTFEQDDQGELLPSLSSVTRHVRLWSDYFLRWSPLPSFLPLPVSIRGMRLAARYTCYTFISLSALLFLSYVGP